MTANALTYPTRLPGEFWGIAAYFNPAAYSSKLANLEEFCRGVRRQGLKLLVVELAFGDAPFLVDEVLCDRVLRLRSNTVLWHKERLLNLGLSHLPEQCDKVAWLDADILFENDGWVQETDDLLEAYPVVQPYATACWLPPGAKTAPETALCNRGIGEGQSMPAMAHVMSHTTDRRRRLSDYLKDGHTGFGWAARRSLLSTHGFYDAMILGGADFFMAHAMCGNRDVSYGRDWSFLLLPSKQREHLTRWCKRLYEDVRGSVFHTRGTVLHLWHGSAARRGYTERFDILREEHFDPTVDIAYDENGCWKWSSDKPELHRRIRQYFQSRQEDSTSHGP